MSDLESHASNTYSQNGEDGILAEIFRRLGIAQGYFTEFGAWDGQHLSNCYALFERGWSGCYIEGDPTRYADLQRNVVSDRVRHVLRFVSPDGPDSLDHILLDVGAPRRLDLLSIDVDGDDLLIWQGLHDFRPKCVIIEYNSTIPFDTEFVNKPGMNWGNSAKSLVTLAENRNYVLVAHTSTNLVFLDGDGVFAESGLARITLEDIVVGPRYFWGYDGTMLRSKTWDSVQGDPAPEVFLVPWTNTLATQPLPRVMRGYHDGPSLKSRLRTGFTMGRTALTRPASLVTELRRRR